MIKADLMKVDIKLLVIFCTVYDEGSISQTSKRLELSQPLISHALDRLRTAFHDPLFVRAGRSIMPTERAHALAPEISKIVERLISLSEPDEVDLEQLDTRFCIAANDLESKLITPYLFHSLIQQAPNTSLRIMNTREPIIDRLRARECDLIVTPLTPPDMLDIYSEVLFKDQCVCYFDPSILSAEEVQANYCDLDHAIVQFSNSTLGAIDDLLNNDNIKRNIQLAAPNFEALPALIRGTRLITTLPSKLQHNVLAGFGTTPAPVELPEESFHMIWHQSTHISPQHRWFRSLVRAAVEQTSN